MSALALPDEAGLDALADPGQYVLLACERAKTWLQEALEHGDISSIVELKSQADAIRIYSAQKQLGSDAVLAATEIVRRAERGIGVSIRAGQERGEVGSRVAGRNQPFQGNQWTGKLNGDDRAAATTISPRVYGKQHDLEAAYQLTDGISDEAFETALTEGREVGNLSRAHLARRLRDQVFTPKRHPLLHKTRRLDSNRIVAGTVAAVEGVGGELFEHIDYTALDRTQLEPWVASLSESIHWLSALRGNLKKEMANVGQTETD